MNSSSSNLMGYCTLAIEFFWLKNYITYYYINSCSLLRISFFLSSSPLLLFSSHSLCCFSQNNYSLLFFSFCYKGWSANDHRSLSFTLTILNFSHKSWNQTGMPTSIIWNHISNWLFFEFRKMGLWVYDGFMFCFLLIWILEFQGNRVDCLFPGLGRSSKWVQI